MIAARKLVPFNFVLRRWLIATIRKRFHNVYLIGGQNLRRLDLAKPVVGCVNHTNWWDGFVLYVLSHLRVSHDIYLAMEERNLRRYRFFTWMGVFGLDLTDRRSSLAGTRYALRLLRPGRLLWIFVQGRMHPPQAEIEVRPGAGFLARHTDAQILPLALRYEWLNESRPSIFVNVGEPLGSDASDAELARVLKGLMGEVEKCLEPIDLERCEPLFPASMSINKRWDRFRHRLFGKRDVFDKINR